MKKGFCILLAVLFIFSAFAMADETIAKMRVVNCEEWVSLRAAPSTSAERLISVPLGEIVRNCTRVDSRFTYAEYAGECGYILTSYLQKVEEPTLKNSLIPYAQITAHDAFFSMEKYGVTVIASRSYDLTDGEILYVGGYTTDGNKPLWGWSMGYSELGQYTATDAFLGGTELFPYIMMYNSSIGLAAVDFYDGEFIWQLSESLGGSICHTVAEDGTVYIAGFEGPDPVAISVDGELLWRSFVDNDDIYWSYLLEITEDGILCSYDSGDDTQYYAVLIGNDGSVLDTYLLPRPDDFYD